MLRALLRFLSGPDPGQLLINELTGSNPIRKKWASRRRWFRAPGPEVGFAENPISSKPVSSLPTIEEQCGPSTFLSTIWWDFLQSRFLVRNNCRVARSMEHQGRWRSKA